METNPLLDHTNAALILEEAWRLFQQKGYRGVSMDELCARCRLTKPTLYYYFQDKETLFVQVLQHKLHGFRTAAEAPGSLAERLQAVAAAILDSFQTEYSVLLRDREHIKRPEHQLQIREAFHAEMFGPLNALMQDGIERGELLPAAPQTHTLVFLGIINNFIGRAAEMGLSTDALSTTLTRYFLKGAAQ
jgi:AcrR family transcriptional regulator